MISIERKGIFFCFILFLCLGKSRMTQNEDTQKGSSSLNIQALKVMVTTQII